MCYNCVFCFLQNPRESTGSTLEFQTLACVKFSILHGTIRKQKYEFRTNSSNEIRKKIKFLQFLTTVCVTVTKHRWYIQGMVLKIFINFHSDTRCIAEIQPYILFISFSGALQKNFLNIKIPLINFAQAGLTMM